MRSLGKLSGVVVVLVISCASFWFYAHALLAGPLIIQAKNTPTKELLSLWKQNKKLLPDQQVASVDFTTLEPLRDEDSSLSVHGNYGSIYTIKCTMCTGDERQLIIKKSQIREPSTNNCQDYYLQENFDSEFENAMLCSAASEYCVVPVATFMSSHPEYIKNTKPPSPPTTFGKKNLPLLEIEDNLPESRVGLLLMHKTGKNLRKIAQKNRHFIRHNLLKTAKQASTMFQVMHQQNILHGDIKLENITLDAANNVRVIDFGQSCLVNSPATQTLLGTGFYHAPEQCEPTPQGTTASDVFAFGNLLYFLHTGVFIQRDLSPEEPFEELMQLMLYMQTTYRSEYFKYLATLPETAPQFIANMRHDRPEFEVVPAVKFTTLVLAMLHPDPEYRPSMALVRQLLDRVLL